MKKGYSRFLKLINFTGDISLLNLSFLGSFVFLDSYKGLNEFDNHYFFLHLLFNLTWLIIVLISNTYSVTRAAKIENILWNALKAVISHGLIIFSFIASIKGYYYSRNHLLITYLIFTVLIVGWRILFHVSLQYYRKRGSNFRTIVIVGAGAVGNDIYSYFTSDKSLGYQFLGFFDDQPEKCIHKELVLGPVSLVKEFCLKEKVDEIYCALPLHAGKTIKDLITFADNNLIRIKIVPDFRGFLNKKVNIDFYDHVPVMTLRPEPLESILNRIVKRTFDIVFSLGVILLIFPWLFPIFIILVKLSSKGPVFFVQQRSGRSNEIFNCYKFRSMAVNEEADKKQATFGDARITSIGKFLRKTNLDELPQFFNVLMGNMSVVGPRPHMLKHTEEYSKLIDKFMVRHLVKPGITGWAQVNGYRGATHEIKMMLKRVRYDVWYIENWSLLLDIRIIFMTVVNMVRGEKNAF